MALTDNLISYWKLDEASGNALDAHGSNDLTDNGSVGSDTGKISNARDLESGSSQYFNRADNADLSSGDIDFTIAAWVKAESFGANRSIAGKFLSIQREWQLFYNQGNSRFIFWVSTTGSNLAALATANNFGAPSTGTWYHVVAWHDSVNNEIGISVNAGTPNTTSHSGGVYDGTGQFSIGSRADGNDLWDGLIDEVGWWKRVLTSDERTELYNSGDGLSYDDFGGGGSSVLALDEGMLVGGLQSLSGGLE